MADSRFYNSRAPLTIDAIAKHSDCKIEFGEAKPNLISNISPLSSATREDLVFLSNSKYANAIKTTIASASIVDKNFTTENKKITLLRCDNPYYSYSLALKLFYSPKQSTKSDQFIHPLAKIGNNSSIAHNVVIESGVEIGDNVTIAPHTYIGQGVKIGNNARIESNVSIIYSIIGDDVVILNGAKIGQDGFGFATHQGTHHKIFHIGRVIIGNNVEIGANTTIDRGSLQDTTIEEDVRIDNLVQIGHNVLIGKGSIIVAQVGIAGSSRIGKYCALGGQVGVSGHVSIADQVQVSGQGGVIHDIKDSKVILGGTPAVPIRDWHKQSIVMKHLVKKGMK